ncbi:MAG: hypothetical protein ACP6IY_08395 [Promethearchaeia archaeon]
MVASFLILTGNTYLGLELNSFIFSIGVDIYTPISDDGMPQTQFVESATPNQGEKPKRPKLDDILDSVIVLE